MAVIRQDSPFLTFWRADPLCIATWSVLSLLMRNGVVDVALELFQFLPRVVDQYGGGRTTKYLVRNATQEHPG